MGSYTPVNRGGGYRLTYTSEQRRRLLGSHTPVNRGGGYGLTYTSEQRRRL